jgi:hypothetical protein
LLETAPYLTPTISPNLDQTNTDPVAEGSIVRPDLIGNPIPSHQTSSNYFNLNALAPTPAGAARVGSAGVGILEGPGPIAVNAGLSKSFVIREGLRLRFEATFANALNHTNFAPPAVNVSNPSTFGVPPKQRNTAEIGQGNWPSVWISDSKVVGTAAGHQFSSRSRIAARCPFQRNASFSF